MSTNAVAVPPDEDEQEETEQFDSTWGGDGYPDMPAEKQKILKDLLKTGLTRELSPRRSEVIEARQQRFYSRSVQYIYFDWKLMGFAPLMQGDDSSDQERYAEVYDIYSAFARTLIAALSQNPVGAHMVPRTAKRTVDITAASVAEQYKNRVEQVNDIKSKQVDVARLFCTDGRVVGMVTDALPDSKYGMDAENNPMGAELLEVDGILEWKVPTTQNDMKDWPYAIRSKELELETAQEKYPDAVDEAGESKIKGGNSASGESAFERFARLGVLQGGKQMTATAESWNHLATEHIAFFRKDFFRSAPKAERDWLNEAFPEGLKLVVTGDAYCGAWSESMDRRVRVAHAKPGDGQNRTSLLKAFVAIQDAFNDFWNLRKELHEYCIPEKWIDKETFDLVAQQEHRSEPGNSNPVVMLPGESISDKIFVENSVQISADLVEAINDLSGELAQLITAALPSLMGSGDEHNETGKGIAMMREQALGQMGISWGASQQLLAQLEELAIRQAGKKAPESLKMSVKVPGGRSAPDAIKEVEIAELNAGDFYAEVDTSFPDTRAMKRAVFNSLLAMSGHSPALQQMLALPENQELFKEMVDDDLEVPGADARIQQLREIEELLKSGPTPPPDEAIVQALMQQAVASLPPGSPPPPPPTPQELALLKQQPKAQQLILSMSTPTVPIDADWDMHPFHVEVISDWLAGEACEEEKEAGNLPGIQNVKLHGALHKKAIAAAAQPPQGKPPSVSINYADLPPDGQLQAAKEAGISLNPQIMAASEMHKESQAKPAQGAPNA